jgi:hypothetical protein
MKALRFLALLIAVGAVSVFPARVYGQQEVDPDHFDQSTVHSSKSHSAPKASSVHHHPQHARLANRHAGSKAHQHSAPVLS